MAFLDALIYGIRDILYPGTTAIARKSRLQMGAGMSASLDAANNCIRVDALATTQFNFAVINEGIHEGTRNLSLDDGYRRQIVTVDTTGGRVSIATPEDATVGYELDLHVGRAAATHSATFTDPNGYLFQDPDHPGDLLETLVFDQPRNLYLTLLTDIDDTYWSI